MDPKNRLISRASHHDAKASYYELCTSTAVRAAAWYGNQNRIGDQARQLAKAARWKKIAEYHQTRAVELREELNEYGSSMDQD